MTIWMAGLGGAASGLIVMLACLAWAEWSVARHERKIETQRRRLMQ